MGGLHIFFFSFFFVRSFQSFFIRFSPRLSLDARPPIDPEAEDGLSNLMDWGGGLLYCLSFTNGCLCVYEKNSISES
jgi:hypothetical protein